MTYEDKESYCIFGFNFRANDAEHNAIYGAVVSTPHWCQWKAVQEVLDAHIMLDSKTMLDEVLQLGQRSAVLFCELQKITAQAAASELQPV